VSHRRYRLAGKKLRLKKLSLRNSFTIFKEALLFSYRTFSAIIVQTFPVNPMDSLDAPPVRVVYRKYQDGILPAYHHPPYTSSVKRSPRQPLVPLPQTLSELTAPTFVPPETIPSINLAKGPHGDAVGERILVSGRVLDEDGRAVPGTLVEIWQANAAGRYLHARDQHDAPLDPNFTGCAHFVTDPTGRFAFETIRPGAYPWRNHYNAWRPAHIHFSVFGPAFATRLITQMYFPGDQLLPFDPIFNSIRHEAARNRLIASFNWDTTVPEYGLAYRFDIVLRGRDETPMENKP
jgi:protocatechuate 3,4-dioxygenase, beta subunit